MDDRRFAGRSISAQPEGVALRCRIETSNAMREHVLILFDRAGDLWVGGEGVFRFNGTSFDRMH